MANFNILSLFDDLPPLRAQPSESSTLDISDLECELDQFHRTFGTEAEPLPATQRSAPRRKRSTAILRSLSPDSETEPLPDTPHPATCPKRKRRPRKEVDPVWSGGAAPQSARAPRQKKTDRDFVAKTLDRLDGMLAEGKKFQGTGQNPRLHSFLQYLDKAAAMARKYAAPAVNGVNGVTNNSGASAAPELSEGDAVCLKCGSRDSAQGNLMLLCDASGCPYGCHMQCLSPPLEDEKDLPDGDWFCSKCETSRVQTEADFGSTDGNANELTRDAEASHVGERTRRADAEEMDKKMEDMEMRMKEAHAELKLKEAQAEMKLKEAQAELKLKEAQVELKLKEAEAEKKFAEADKIRLENRLLCIEVSRAEGSMGDAKSNDPPATLDAAAVPAEVQEVVQRPESNAMNKHWKRGEFVYGVVNGSFRSPSEDDKRAHLVLSFDPQTRLYQFITEAYEIEDGVEEVKMQETTAVKHLRAISDEEALAFLGEPLQKMMRDHLLQVIEGEKSHSRLRRKKPRVFRFDD